MKLSVKIVHYECQKIKTKENAKNIINLMFLHPMHIFNKDLEYEMRCGRIFQEERNRQNAKWRKKKQKNLIHVFRLVNTFLASIRL